MWDLWKKWLGMSELRSNNAILSGYVKPKIDGYSNAVRVGSKYDKGHTLRLLGARPAQVRGRAAE